MSSDIEAFIEAVRPSSDELARLKTYDALLRKWNKRINLVAPQSLPQAWSRHFLDSAQVLQFAGPSDRVWADLGSGGGFPGLVVAILAKDRLPDLRVTLVESDQRKAAFLRSVSRETELYTRIIAERIEALESLQADILSARALAPLDSLLSYAHVHLKPGGRAVFPKGASHAQEVSAALANWRFTLQKETSRSNPDAALLTIGDIARA